MIKGGLQPTIVQLKNDHYFFDMGQERMGGVVLTVPAETVEAWGGASVEVEVRLSEMLAGPTWPPLDPHKILFPGKAPLDPGNWNRVPKWSSILTLTNGTSHFEQHEYVGPWRYGEVLVKNDKAKDCKQNFSLTQWSVGYPWVDEATFNSSDDMLNKVWGLCRNTLQHTTLETFTDSNVRERTPYEADLFCAAGSFWALRSERALVKRSAEYVINNPTWPTDW
jgi:hypothetical protein